jgi:phosphate butyryltransferase
MTRINDFEHLLAAADDAQGSYLVVAAPFNTETLQAVQQIHDRFKIPISLVGDSARIGAVAAQVGGIPPSVRIHHAVSVQEGLDLCMSLLRESRGGILLKGSVDTATLLRAVLDEKNGLRTGRLLSDVFLVQYPRRGVNTIVMITDGGVTVAPDLKAKVDLIQNAVAVAHALGNDLPKVAVLSATEFVNPALPSTVDAALLTAMNRRGQITGCVVDGPLALDNAVSFEAAGEKGITSPVAGEADILVAPSIEAANLLAKATTYFAGLRLAHVIVGARVPVLIPSRADKSDAKLLSVALGMVMNKQGGFAAAG